ncbi:MAG: S8 family serine peptidase, partial [Candidatus Eisenbacteria bacterium]|nr:S8 family serine peptidase [Candidatus Eisenbacteria bacterium]
QGEDGNLGFHLAGIIGANYFDNPSFSGAHPGFDQLEVFGVPITGYDVFDLDVKLHTYLDDLNKNWVLATCLVRPDIPPMDQAVLAVMWQQDTELDLFLHVSKAGDTGEAGDYTANAANTSHWNMAGSYVDLALFLEDAGEPNIEGFYDLVDILDPPGQSENLITVGYSELSSDPEAPFKKALNSALLPDIETYGTDILGPCAPDGEAFDCPDGAMTQTGSAVATAHVAGVGAYLTSISPEKAPEEIRDVLEFAGTEGQHEHMIDAYTAVLALDPPQSQWFQNAATPRARMAVLDVAGDSDAPGENGIFDDHDIRVLLDQFTFYEAERAVPGNELDFDFAPYDLNGDGWTGGESVSPLDLDANRSFGDAALEAGGFTVIKNEKSLTDLDILCYYAYSTLYMGSTERRSEMLSDCFPPSAIALDVTFPEIIEPGIPQTIQVVAGRNTPDGIVYEAGTRININVSNGDVDDSSGETDASGIFMTTITLDEDENEVDIIVQASFDSGETAEKELTARRENEVLIIDREMEMQAYTSMSYNVNQGDNLTIVFDEIKSDDDDDLFDSYENTEQTANQGSALGQNYSASARTQYETQVSGGQGAVTGIEFDATVEAEVELSGIPNVFNYQVWASGDAELDVEFQIWGEARAVNLNATLDTENYEVVLSGEGTSIVCGNNPFLEDGNMPCDSISESLVLRPGNYRLNVTLEGIVFLQPDQQAAGTNSVDYELSLRLDIGQAVADPPSEE